MNFHSVEDISLEYLEHRLEQFLAHRRLHARSGVKTVDLCGVKVDNVRLRGVLRSVCIQISQRHKGYIVTPNVDHVCMYQTDADLRDAYEHAMLILADGTPLLWAGRLLGTPLREKLSGSDMIYRLSEFAAARGFSVYFLGAAEGVASTAAERLRQMYPGLDVAGIDSPPVGFTQDAELNGRTVQRLADSDADICFVALGSPKQEVWMRQNSERANVPVMIGIGASFDFVAGISRRAPIWMQHAGLEWFWRLCHEPRRLWRRYLLRDPKFLVLVGRHMASKIGGRLKGAAGNEGAGQ